MSALPTAATPGYSLWPGTSKVGCDCVIELLTVAEQLGLALGLIRESLDVVQLVGTAAASAGVHTEGSAFDLRQRSPEWVRLLREMGAAYFPREGAAWEGNEHGHGVITCPHDRLTEYQMTAYRRGYNGLGQGPAGSAYAGQWGYGGRDTYWRPATFRTTAQGIAWARSEIERLTMPTSQEIAHAVIHADIVRAPADAGSPTAKANPDWTMESYLRETFRLVDRVAAQDKARDDKLAAQLGSLAGIVAALDRAPGGITFDQALAAAEQGAAKALADRITSATVELRVDEPPTTG